MRHSSTQDRPEDPNTGRFQELSRGIEKNLRVRKLQASSWKEPYSGAPSFTVSLRAAPSRQTVSVTESPGL